jgi:hypothetical protein
VTGTVPGGKHDQRLHEQVGGERAERAADQPQRPPLPLLTGARQFPQDDRARPDLDQRVQPETGQRHRPRGHRGDREHGDPSHVPAERDPLQDPAAAQQDPGPVGRGSGERSFQPDRPG